LEPVGPGRENMPSIQLIVGLANPGKKYADTRHNAGAWFIEMLTRNADINLNFEAKYQGLYGLGHLGEHSFHLLIPTTYMNLSGQAVSACMRYHKIPPNAVLVVHDDIDLPVGSIKLKFDGGNGGHNGLKDIISHLNTKQFYRLRIGVGHPGNSKDVIDYVLKHPSKVDKQKIDDVLAEGQEILPLILAGEMQKAMQKLHTETK
jgi:PTH1 family peptidyl-tRNA hydrolase